MSHTPHTSLITPSPSPRGLTGSRAREDLRLASERITAMLADYSDVVPRREFERLEANYQV